MAVNKGSKKQGREPEHRKFTNKMRPTQVSEINCREEARDLKY